MQVEGRPGEDQGAEHRRGQPQHDAHCQREHRLFPWLTRRLRLPGGLGLFGRLCGFCGLGRLCRRILRGLFCTAERLLWGSDKAGTGLRRELLPGIERGKLRRGFRFRRQLRQLLRRGSRLAPGQVEGLDLFFLRRHVPGKLSEDRIKIKIVVVFHALFSIRRRCRR